MSATVGTVVSAYLRYCERQNRADKFSSDHLAIVRQYLHRFQAFIGADKPVAECKQHDLSSWVDAHPQWKSVSAQRNAVAAVTGAFRFAAEEELIDHAPYRTPRSLRGAVAEPRRPATHDEYRALFVSGSRALRAALFFLRETGARTAEMRESLWTDIEFGNHPKIELFRHKTARKTGQSRVIALNSVVARFLLWLKRSGESIYVFTNCEGTPWNRHTFARHLRRTAERIGLDEDVTDRVTGYCLRHTFCCAALTAGFTTKEVADQMGHADTKMVERIYGTHTAKDMAYMTRVANAIRERRA